MTEFEAQLKNVLSQAYDIERELGGGGMSRVFVATDRVLGRKIVIKLLSPELIADVNRGRFRREIQVAAQLQHPHIVPLLSAGEHEDLLYFTMPFIAGESLRQSVEKTGPMLIPDVMRVLYHVGEALDYAHGEGVVHRDIKPANILRSGTYALVTDFGVAKALNASMPSSGMTSTGMAIGTPAYMAPEQLAGDPMADHRIDIYALGLLAYELLNGRSPYAATSPQKVLAAVLTQDPPTLSDVRPDVPRALSDMVMKCLAKEPGDRYATAREMLNSLDNFSSGSGEITTMEHRVRTKKVEKTAPATTTTTTATATATATATPTPTPTPTPTEAQAPISATVTPADEAVIGAETSVDDVDAPGYDAPKKSGKGMLIGGIVIVALAIGAGAYFMSASSSSSPTNVTASIAPVDSTATTAAAAPAAVAALPVAPTDSLSTVTPKLDSAAVADSIRKVAAAKRAKADSLKKAAQADSIKKAAAKEDSIKRVQGSNKTKARSAAIWLFADPTARQTFIDGATHMGGVLGKQRKGNLQSQIDALQPFLKRAGITYDQFKAVMQESGVSVYDEFGRMVPDSVKKFTGVNFGK